MAKLERFARVLINSHLAMFLVALLILPISAIGLMSVDDDGQGAVLSTSNQRDNQNSTNTLETQVQPEAELYLDPALYDIATGQTLETELEVEENQSDTILP